MTISVIGDLIMLVLCPMVFSYGILLYSSHPLYNLYATAAILAQFVYAIVFLIASFAFLWKIYDTKKISFNVFLYDWIINQGSIIVSKQNLVMSGNVTTKQNASHEGHSQRVASLNGKTSTGSRET
ncbi:hypothetical protein HDV03_003416 [Kappamyces sp. JEL0829]|nr:hypothetical protein HDV03_003416 [Kappamyces sp. JEL0829]